MNIIDNPILRGKFMDQFHIAACFEKASDFHFDLVGFAKDEYLIKEGEEIDCLYFILLGKVKCYSCSTKRDFGIFYMNKGLLGDAEFVTGRVPTRTVVATSEVLCLRLKVADYRHKLKNDNFFLTYITQQLAEKLTLSETTPQDNAADMSGEERLLEYLKITAIEGRVAQSLGEISDVMGYSYRHLIRMMNTLCDTGKLRHGKRKGAYFIN